MPLSRYEIRNEYSLGDPDLYRAADKDDPEALLEGVAMAGLVGVLRQLGDLAEFAAEIFHGLHEEVTATASRGHSLMVRVQQLEAEFPTIEKAFLSQTSHSSFYYSAGIDWHPNVRMDQNLITQGDLPRFIMDSYEECRGPPRLFLLDKFDVAGAGACLKRYTDPSVFNVGTSYSGITSSDVLREKKARKAKKKGSRWRNAETPETLPSSSHAKLHQLFLEERIGSGASDSVRRVKLKRRLNGFPFDNRSGNSYMEKFLKSSSPDHEEVHEIPVDASPLVLPYDRTYESALEIVEISRVSPEKESKWTMRSPSSSPTREGTTLEMAFGDLNEFPSPKGVYEVSKSNSCLEATDISSILHKGVTEKEISVDGGIKTEGSIDDYQSDDIASEIDNYVDALTTMESEMDTDSELRSKNDLHYMNRRSQASEIDANGEQVHANFSDSLSMGNSSLSDDGNSSSKKDLSSFSCSDSHSISAENTPSDGEVSSNVFSSTEIHEAEDSSTQQSIGREGQTVSDDAFMEPVEIPSLSSELDDTTASSIPSDSGPFDKNEEAGVKEIASLGPEMENMVAKLNVDLPLISSANPCQQEGDYSCSQMSIGNQHVNEFEDENINKTENMGYTSHLSVPSLSRNGLPFQVSAENKSTCKIEDEDSNQQEDLGSTCDCTVVPHVMDENPSLLSSETRPPHELHDEDPNWRENSSSASNHSDTCLQSQDYLSPKMSAENLQDDSDVEIPNFHLDVPVCASDTTDAATQNKITENMLENVSEIGHVEYNFVPDAVENHVDTQNLVITHTKDKSIDPTSAELETHYSKVPLERDCEIDDAIPSDGEKPENVIFKEDIPIICRQSFVSGTADIQPLGPSNEITSHFREEDFDEPSNPGDDAVKDEANSDPHLLEKDTTSEPSLMAGSNVRVDKVDHEPLDVPATLAGHSIHAAEDDDDDGSSVDHKKLLEEPFTIVKDVHNGVETGLSDGPQESDITEGLDHQKFASPDSLCNLVSDYDMGLQACDDASDVYIVAEARSSLTPGDVPTCQLSVGQNEEELHHPEEKFDLEMQESKEKLHNGGEANSELLNQLQQTHYSDHDEQAGTFDASSEPLLANIPSQPSASEPLPDGNSMIDVTEHLLDRSSLLSSGYSLPPFSSQIYIEEMPPLPPLPPVQWRMGKLQHANQAPVEASTKHSPTAFPPLLPCSTNQAAQPLVPFLPPSVSAYEMSIPVLEQPISNISPFLSQAPPVVHDGDSKDNVLPPEGITCTSTSAELPGSHGEMLQNVFHAGKQEKVPTSLDSSISSFLSQAPPVVHDGDSKDNVLSPEGIACTSTSAELPGSHGEMLQNVFHAGEQEKVPTSLDSSISPFLSQAAPVVHYGDSKDNVLPPEGIACTSTLAELPGSHGEMLQNIFHAGEQEKVPTSLDSSHPSAIDAVSSDALRLANQEVVAPEKILKDTELGQCSAQSEDNVMASDTTELPPNVADEDAMPTSEEKLSWSTTEDGKLHGVQTLKLARPRNPLIDAVAAHDKSKLRRVTERVSPHIQKEDERDSMLEQIRTKSFNLKRAVVNRPSIQGPKTNLKVAAILEKAKTIRQAFAGSDEEEDDDSWSDS